jgi:hypothetical protein
VKNCEKSLKIENHNIDLTAQKRDAPVGTVGRVDGFASGRHLGVEEDVGGGLGRERVRLEYGHVGAELDALRLQDVELPVELLTLLADILQAAVDVGLEGGVQFC